MQVTTARAACSVASLTVAALLLVNPLLHAQSLGHADSLSSAGDTSAAIEEYEEILKRHHKNAEAHYRVGLLYWELGRRDGRVSRNRRSAEEHLRYATRLESDSAKYWLALANIFRTATEATMRVQWGRALRRAQERAQEHESPDLAAAEYQLGRMAWEQYERRGRRFVFQVGSPGRLPGGSDFQGWRDFKNIFENRMRQISVAGAGSYSEAEDHLRAALAQDRHMVTAGGLLVILLGNHRRWEEALEVSRRLVANVPDSAYARMLHGLVLTRLERYKEAEAAQAQGLALFPSDLRREYEDLSRILPKADSQRLAHASDEERASFRDLYWGVAQPLYLRDVNEVRTEYLARLAEVDVRWSEPESARRGWDTDRGAVFLRWGPPDIAGTIGNNKTLWVYPELKLFFQFSGSSGYTYAQFAFDHRAIYEELSSTQPASFLNVPPARRIDSAVVQVAQFRGPTGGDSSDVAIFAFVPVGRMLGKMHIGEVTLNTGLFIKDQQLRDIWRETSERRVRTGEPDQMEMRSWRLTLRPAQTDYTLRVEALSPELDRAARGNLAIKVRSFPPGALRMSDVVIARRVVPRDSSPESWREFFIEPSAGELSSNSSIGLLWEIYNLEPDSTGVARFEVDVAVTVRSIERREFGARLIGGFLDAIGASAKGDETISLAYDAEAAVERDGRHVEYLTLALEDAPNGEYGLRVTVTDERTQETTSRTHRFVVETREPASQ